MIKLVHVKRGDMMKKLLISLLSVGMLLGIFGVTNSNIGLPNVMEETVQADTNSNDSRTINYAVYKENSNALSPVNTLFTKSATVNQNDDGTYKVTVIARTLLGDVNVPTIGGHDTTVTKGDNGQTKFSFNIDDLNDLDNNMSASVQPSVVGISGSAEPVTFKFDMSSLDSHGTSSSVADSLNKITSAENNITNTANSVKGLIDDLNSNATTNNDSNIISTPSTSTSTTNTNNSSNRVDPKTILKDLTYKISKNNGDGSLISPYFTNTAKVMQNPDGSYYVEVTVKYPKKFGNNAFLVNSINNQKPSNVKFSSDGDSNYLTFDFPLKKLTDLSNLIPGDITMNIPDYGLNKDLGFNLDFDGLNPDDLSKLMSNDGSSDDLSGLISDLGNLSNLGDVKTDNSSNADKQNTGTLPQTGNQTDTTLVVIGGIILVLWVVLLKGTYCKH